MTSTSTEQAPLLEASEPTHKDVYRRFSSSRKSLILATVSFTGLIPLFVGGTFVPSIPDIAKDLDSTGAIISLAVSLSVFAASLGSLIGASYSTFYGRRPIYLTCIPLLIFGSFGVASAPTVSSLMVWRFIQAIGSSPGLAVGAGVIGDIYKLEERGTAMGIYFAAILLGPALAPFAGGFTAHYYSWRVMQFALGVVAIFALALILVTLPETSHPGERGIDKLDPSSLPTWRPVLINPLRPLWLLRSPNLLAITFAGLTTLLTDYVLLVPLAYTIGVRYNITNSALIGACFLPAGVGNMIGAPLAGRYSDYLVVKYRKARGGEWYPEDRLRGTLIGGFVMVPLSVLCAGIVTHFIPGKLGLTLNLICLFINGLGVDFVLSPSAAYFVDLLHSRSAEAMAANNGLRAMITSIIIAGILPMIESCGVLITNLCAAIFAWVGFVFVWYTIRNGDKLRSMVDVGFSTAENN
ncbi:major facilitator superfamily domain-containing protein [Panaeolus papilionaceus]|nr:major facilitator superfamily domain-containing protein [Panaeolus papilionaceus]